MSNIMCVYIYTISSSLFDTSCEALSVDVECIVLFGGCCVGLFVYLGIWVLVLYRIDIFVWQFSNALFLQCVGDIVFVFGMLCGCSLKSIEHLCLCLSMGFLRCS